MEMDLYELNQPKSVRFEVVLFKILSDAFVAKQGNYHNPTRQRGIPPHAPEFQNSIPHFRVAKIENAQLQKSVAAGECVKNCERGRECNASSCRTAVT